jgi:ribosomal protein S18 acetylase RimI-like enzyme
MLTIIPFDEEHLDSAAGLLSDRHHLDRQNCLHLPARFEQPEEARRAVQAAWRKSLCSGVAALEGSRMVGYLFADAQFDQLMGRTAWVRIAGHALAVGEDPDVYQYLYAAAAPTWLEMGCFNHYIQVMAGDVPALAAWFATSFGQQQAYGLRPILASDAEPRNSMPGIEIRRARPEDRQAFAEMAFCTADYQVQPPVWAPLPPEIAAERPLMYASVLDDEDATLWLAMKDDRVAGFQVYYPAENKPEDLYIPEHAAEMPAASTRPEFRGMGVTRALAEFGFDHLRQEGFGCCLTDWRTTNLLSARAWPSLGYQPVMYRLHRRVDERILWARGLRGTE